MLKLTPRQQTFLDKLFDLYRDSESPVHYSTVAEKLGVNKFSAYDMLKVLEEKGVAASDYVLNNEQAGPGRSQVVFYPTNKAAQFLTQLRDEQRHYSSEWQRAKDSILERLATAREANPVEVIRESLSNLSNTKTSLNYCAEMVSVMLLNLQRQSNLNVKPALDSLRANGTIGLGTLVGLNLASVLSSSADTNLAANLMDHTKDFQKHLSELSDDSLNKLAIFLNDALNTMQPSPEFAAI